MSKDHMEYTYASARIRAMEGKLFDSAAAERMLECRTAAEMLKVLADCGYEAQGVDPDDAGAVDLLVSAERARVFADVTSMAPDPSLFSFFLYPYDYHNIKVALKSEQDGRKAQALLMTAGTVPPEELLEAVRARTFSGMTERMAKGAEEALAVYARTRDPQMIDIVLDRWCFADMLACAERTKSPFAVGFLRLQIDLVNLKALLRLKRAERPQEFAAQVFCEGGDIPADALCAHYDEPVGVLAELWGQTPAGALLTRGAEHFEQPGAMGTLELLADNIQMDYVRGARDVLFGMEPLIGFLYAKEAEFKAVKIIAAGILSGLPGENIRERLREAYV